MILNRVCLLVCWDDSLHLDPASGIPTVHLLRASITIPVVGERKGVGRLGGGGRRGGERSGEERGRLG